jgi:hypothetical protein
MKYQSNYWKLVHPSPFLCCHIINKSLSTGIFPDRMKYSIITPLHKKGDKNNVANFRPISLLPFFSKIIKKVIYKRLMDHLLLQTISLDLRKIHQL